MENLATILAGRPDDCDCYVIFDLPRSGWKQFEPSPARTRAESLPEVSVVQDVGGRETRLFGAHTSGQAIFYDAAGRQRFTGGITATRAHAGESAGAEAIVDLMHHRPATIDQAPVYGCALIEEKEQN